MCVACTGVTISFILAGNIIILCDTEKNETINSAESQREFVNE